MADRVYPSSKPNGTATTATTNGTNPAFPATKAQLYGQTRPAYRPRPQPRHRRSCCCSCCLWLTLLIVLILFIAAIAGAVFYFLYRPHRPSFSVSALRISQFNLTSSSSLHTKLNLTLTAKNPNNKLEFIYDPIFVTISSTDGVDLGNGTFPSFIHSKKNTTALRASIVNNGGEIQDSSDLSKLKSEMKSKSGVPLKIQLDTKVKVKIGGMKTSKVRIRVVCDGIKATVPTGKTPATASTSNAKCDVDLRIKIWKWTI